jgi:diguanylate cyclase (GGDEF)-like protein/PAS domain S-box-containing protein
MNLMSLEPGTLFAFAALCVLTLVLGGANAVLYRRQARVLEEKRRSDSRYRTVVEQACDGILLVDAASGRVTEANYSVRRRLGYSAEEIVGLKLEDILVETLIDPERVALDTMTNTRSRPRTLQQRCKNGELLDVEVAVSHLEIDGRPMLCYVAHDVTERNNIELELLRNQRRLDHLANHDALTGLPNRRFLRSYLEQASHVCGGEGGFAVLLLDLDNFKAINDSYGHNVGDELLVEVAQQLKKFVGSRGIVARLGGDEFVTVLSGEVARDAVASAADALLRELTTPLRVAGRVINTSVSIGITLYPEDSSDLESVLRNADLAMYKAKEAGRHNVRFFEPDMKSQARCRLTMEQALREALKSQQLVVHYHPQIEIATRRIVALDALVRWAHPQLGLVPPSKFIPIAEESGLIVPIGEHILRTVCEQVVRWQAAGVPTVPVAVNWSAAQLQRQQIVEVVYRILKETGMSPKLLAIEITEGPLVRNLQEHAAAFQALRDLGVRIQIDDFGTGYSSLNYLRKLPVDTLKIDRSFINHVAENPADLAIVSAILSMAKSLGMRVVAEGVETAAQLDVLSRHGCEVAQAFSFSRPLPADQCRTLLQEVAARPSFTDTLRMRLRKDFPAIMSPARVGHDKDADTVLRELQLSIDARGNGDSAL